MSPERIVSGEAQFRQELRSPLNVIVGYCDMMLEDARRAGNQSRVSALIDALYVAREALAAIDTTPAPTVGGGASFRRLQNAATALHEKIGVVTAGARHSVQASDAPTFAEDLCRVEEAAAELVRFVCDAMEHHDIGVGGTASDPALQSRVLIVDDVETNRLLLARRLQREGCTCELAESGEAALQAVERERFDLVLLDVVMPGMTGVDVLRRLKESRRTREIPVLMVSANDDMDNVLRCIELGAEDYLPKPFDPALLSARVRAALERQRLRRSDATYLEAVEVLTRAAADLDSGRVDLPALREVMARADGLGQLARVLAKTAETLSQRENRLREQLRTLRAEMDAAGIVVAPETVSDELQIGQDFGGRYRIDALLGEGGMGVVYRASDRELREDVALKVMRKELLSDPSARERFKSEARLARKMSHPNVVRMHDFGEVDGLCFVSMELVEGVTLRQLLDARGSLAEGAVVAIGSQLARALAVAHERGVLHRDIKPQNLLLEEQGALKVMDFGIARIAAETGTLTQTGMSPGTPAYMAPEQLLGDDVDARADLYACGVVLYESLTGERPFAAPTPYALIASMLTAAPPDARTLRPEASPALAALIGRLLARDRTERPASAREVAETLEALA